MGIKNLAALFSDHINDDDDERLLNYYKRIGWMYTIHIVYVVDI